MARQLIVRATDLLATTPKRVRFDTVQIGPLEIGQPIDQMSFTIDDETGTLGFVPTEDDYCKLIDVDGTTVIFQGRLAQVHARNVPPNGVYYDVAAQGWGALLDRTQITATETYAAGFSDVYIVRDILTKYWGNIASGSPAHVLLSNRSSMPPMTFNPGTTLRSFLDTMATNAFNPFYYVDASKALHWNDVTRLAPWGVSTTSPDGTILHAAGNFDDYVDFTGTAFRVTVNGTGGATYTATDWPLLNKYNARLSDEPLAPAPMRIRQLPDISDTTLTTNTQCQQRAFAELAKVRPRRFLSLSVWESGLFPGMRIDAVNGHRGTLTVPYPRPSQRSVNSSSSHKLNTGLGRFIIQRVTPQLLSPTYTQYDIDAGAYEPALTNALVKL